MQATYDLRKSSIQPLAITFAVAVSLILGGAGGYALKAATEAAVISQAAPVVSTAVAQPMVATHRSQQLVQSELKDQQSQAQSVPAAAPSREGTTWTAPRVGAQ